MKIRKYSIDDSYEMYELFKDKEVTQYLHGIYDHYSLLDANTFISNEIRNSQEIHRAIVNDEDEYVGTVSLRHIDLEEGTAEIEIVVKREYHSKGYAWYAICEILKYAFKELNIRGIYWRVNADNKRAIRFFEKHGFNKLDGDIPQKIKERHRTENNLIWFAVLNGDDFENVALSRKEIAGCKIIKIKTVPTVEAGELSFFEAKKDIDFEIKRIYYISKVPEGSRRGFHAHRNLKQVLFCPYGKIQLILDNGKSREEITLCDPSIGIVIDKPVWREMLWLEKNSVLVVGASDYYDETDYLRDYSLFRKFIGN